METKRAGWVIGGCGRFISKIENSFFKEVVISTKHFSWLCIIVCVFICVLGGQSTWADGDPNDPVPSSSLNYYIGMQQQSIDDANELPITFSEYPLNTLITNQYANLGIVFGGDDPYIRTDGAQPTSPVLGTDNFTGIIEGYFWSSDPNGPATVYSFSLDAGYFDQTYSTLIEWFDLSGSKMGEQYNSTTGIEKFVIEGPGIASFRIGVNTGDAQGYSIDNIDFDPPMALDFGKVDDVNDVDCRSPQEDITYTISYHNRTDETFYDAYVIDYFPDGVDFPAGADSYVFDGNSIQTIEGDPYYDQATHSYLWNIGDITPNDANSIDLEVTVNNYAISGMKLHNVAELWATVYDPNGQNPAEAMIGYATEDTLVCCWGEDPNIIYVDQSAVNGANTGMSWTDAYIDLSDALERATETNCSDAYKIYIAQGTYDPNQTPDWSFVLPNNCSVYGGFPSGGCGFSERNPKKYKTILTGLIDDDTIPDSDTLVEMGDECLLDGITIIDAFEYCIYGSGVDFTIQNCTVTESYEYGIYAEDGNVTVKWCTINSNDRDGIRHNGEGFILTVENSWVLRNGENGIHCRNSTPTAKNSIISESSLVDYAFAGIRLYRPTDTPKLYNLTISNNKAEGVYFEDTGEPNLPDVRNCIIYYNNAPGGNQLAGFEADTVAYNCCIQDCNEVHNNYNDIPEFAYTIDPNGTPDPANYHLAGNSFCIDKGDSQYSDIEDDDYDGDVREMGLSVDIGADEVNPDCNDVANPMDLNADGIVNFEEFALISQVWLSHDPNDPICDPNHPNYISDPNDPGYISELQKQSWDTGYAYNYYTTGDSLYAIDLGDLGIFADHWLWIACWKLEQMEAAAQSQSQSMMSMPLTMSFSSASIESAEFEETTTVDTEATAQTLMEVIVFVDEVIAESPDNVANLEEMRAVLMEQLKATVSKE